MSVGSSRDAAEHRIVTFTFWRPNTWEWECDCGKVGSAPTAERAGVLLDAHHDARRPTETTRSEARDA